MNHRKPEEAIDQSELRKLWDGEGAAVGSDDARVRSEDAMWVFWRRVAHGEAEFDSGAFAAMLTCTVDGKGNVVGELARLDRLPDTVVEKTVAALEGSSDPSAVHGLRHLEARRWLTMHQSPRADVDLDFGAITEKGTSWAAVQAVELLDADQRARLVEVVVERRTFTRSQVHMLKEAVRSTLPR